MTTEEFIEAVNAIGNKDEIDAEASPLGGVLLSKCGELIAALGKHDIKWLFETKGCDVTIPTKILKLMVELAESKEDENKYVILNGKPFLLDGSISTRVFVFNEGNLSFATVSLDEMADFSYTKGELKYWKATLPKNLQEAVDLLTVTVGEAKKVLKNDHME